LPFIVGDFRNGPHDAVIVRDARIPKAAEFQFVPDSINSAIFLLIVDRDAVGIFLWRRSPRAQPSRIDAEGACFGIDDKFRGKPAPIDQAQRDVWIRADIFHEMLPNVQLHRGVAIYVLADFTVDIIPLMAQAALEESPQRSEVFV